MITYLLYPESAHKLRTVVFVDAEGFKIFKELLKQTKIKTFCMRPCYSGLFEISFNEEGSCYSLANLYFRSDYDFEKAEESLCRKSCCFYYLTNSCSNLFSCPTVKADSCTSYQMAKMRKIISQHEDFLLPKAFEFLKDRFPLWFSDFLPILQKWIAENRECALENLNDSDLHRLLFRRARRKLCKNCFVQDLESKSFFAGRKENFFCKNTEDRFFNLNNDRF